MNKFVKWIVTCDFNRIEAIQNIGYATLMCAMIVTGIVQFAEPIMPMFIGIIFMAIGLIVWYFGMGLEYFRERYEEEWNE